MAGVSVADIQHARRGLQQWTRWVEILSSVELGWSEAVRQQEVTRIQCGNNCKDISNVSQARYSQLLGRLRQGDGLYTVQG